MVPEIIPATAEASYPDMFITTMNIMRLPDGRQQIFAHLHNYNKETGELSPNSNMGYEVKIEDIWAEAVRCPMFAQMMGGIVTITSLLYQEQWLKRQIEITEDPTALEAQLAEVEDQLGIT